MTLAAEGSEVLRKCSHTTCAKVETRRGEFKVCSRCRVERYCSGECQAAAWKGRHKEACVDVETGLTRAEARAKRKAAKKEKEQAPGDQ